MNRPTSSPAATRTKPEESLGSSDKVRRSVPRLDAELDERVELEKALEESRLRFRDVVDFSIQGILIHREGKPVFVNPSCARTFGYRSPEEMLAAGDLDGHIAPRDRDRLRKHARERLKGDSRPDEYEFDGLTRDGKTLRLRGIVKMVQWSGQPACQCTFIDISESKKRLEALEQSQARLAALFDNMPLKIIIKDKDGRFQAVNRSMEKAVGLSAAELMGKTAYDLFPADIAERFEADDRIALAENHAVTSEGDVPHPDGSIRTEFMIRFPIKADHGATAALGLIAVDISERKKMESALKKSEERLRSIFANMPFNLSVKSSDGRYLIVNRSFGEALGVTESDAVGKTAFDILSQEDASVLNEFDRDVLNNGEAETREIEISYPDGIKRLVQCTKFPFPSGDSGSPCIATIEVDVTEQQRAEAALKESEERFRNLIEGSIQGILIHRNFKPLFVNEAYAQIFGYDSPEEILAMESVEPLIAAHERERRQRYSEARMRGNPVPSRYEIDAVRKDGSMVTLENSVRTVNWLGAPAIQSTVVDVTERRRSMDALRESEEKFRNLIEGSIQGIFIHKDWTPLFINESYARIHGYDSTNELLSIGSVERLIAPYEVERLRKFQNDRISGASAPESYEYDAVHKDGSIITLQNMVRVVNWDGQQAVQNTVFDITELKRVERALLESEERLTDFSEAASDWFWETDSEHRFNFLSERFETITGMSRGTFLGKRRFEIAPLQPDKNTWIKHLEDLRHRRPVRDFTYWTGDDDSGGRWFRINGIPVFDDAGQFSGYRGTGIDVTEEVERENRARNAEQRFVEALTHVSDGYALFDTSDRLVVCNDTYKRMQGRCVAAKIHPGMSFEELIRVNLDCRTVVDAVGREDTWLAERLARHQTPKIPFEMRRAEDVWYLVREERTSEGGTILLESDITDIKRRENALQQSEQRFKDFAETAADWFFETDAELRFTYVSERYTQLTGLKPEQVIGKTRREILSDSLLEDPEKLEQHFADLEAHRPYEIELKVGRPDGEIRILRFSGKPVHSADGAFLGYRGSGRDITEAKRLEEQMAYQASHDSLTGLVNRHELERRLARILDPDGGTSAEHALCYLDLDQFKVINDTCGHVAGDELLRQLGALLQRHVRKRDTVARLGGDEFGILMEHCPVDQATRIANTLRSAIEDYQFAWEQRTFRIGASIGVVPIGDVGGSVTEVLRAADGACYVAKEQGRNRVHIYRPDDVALTRRRGEMQWVARLHEALDLDRLTLFLQPIVPVKETFIPPIDIVQCKRFEILLRIEEKDGSFISPASFLAAAERYNLATRLDRWVVNAALRWMTQAAKAGKEIELCSINLSAQSLGDAGFLEYLLDLLEIAEVERQSVCFEITETSAIANLNSATQFMSTVRNLGCRFALDDFGSGLSSFAYLKNLPVDFLKIDGAFVRDIASDPIDFAMVRSIADVGKVMGKDIIAEYVESEEVLERVKDIGIDYAQGYFIGAPIPVEFEK
jgi:diguanylate cyclase (GGDEF)-like protein/PAS domain S-box-containing protein